MDFTQFGWRDGVLLIAVGIGVYVAIMLLRLMRIGKRQGADLDLGHRGPAQFDPGAQLNMDLATNAGYELPFHFPPPDTPPAIQPPAAERPEASLAGAAPGVAPAPTFAEALEMSRLDQEVRQLRAEVEALREELRDIQAARRVAPQYADAMALAQRGFDAHGIADHCGIALGEAELVMALARGNAELQAEGEHGYGGSR